MTRSARTAVGLLLVVAGPLFLGLAWARFATLHNHTYDLALYARMAWGFAHADPWEPILGANPLGVHLAPILLPLGVLGALFGTVPVLLFVQAAAVALAAVPFARMAARRFGAVGTTVAAAAWLAQPNLLHVATYEFHPGTVAVLPLAWALEALDRRDGRAFLVGVVGALACREDLAAMTALLALLALATAPSIARSGRAALLGSVLWLLLFAAVLHPLFRPTTGSVEAHFGKWGGSLSEMVGTWLGEPGRVLEHLGAPRRLSYLPRVLATFAFLPLLSPRWLVPTLPVFALALLSEFPTTVRLDSHYLTPALPFLMAAAIDGAGRLGAWVGDVRARRRLLGAAVVAYAVVLFAGAVHPGVPTPTDFVADDRTRAGRAVLARIPDHASVQAPDFLLAHLAERSVLHRGPPPERETAFVVLDAWQRARWAGEETLLRTTEEPVTRNWLARDDHGLVAAAGELLLLERGADPRGGAVARYLEGVTAPEPGDRRLAACLALRAARRIAPDRVALELVARGPCPSDLALRVDGRVDLLFDGRFSPAHVREGDLVRSEHAVASEAAEITLGALRSSGARPEPDDPVSVRVVVRPRAPRPR